MKEGCMFDASNECKSDMYVYLVTICRKIERMDNLQVRITFNLAKMNKIFYYS